MRLADGEELTRRAAIWPSSRRKPATCSICRPIRRWHDGLAHALPIRAACLDLALGRLPRPDNRFAPGARSPVLFFRAFRRREAGAGGRGRRACDEVPWKPRPTLRHTPSSKSWRAFSINFSPAGRSTCLARRFLPNMTVAHGLPSARERWSAGPAGGGAARASQCVSGWRLGRTGRNAGRRVGGQCRRIGPAAR